MTDKTQTTRDDAIKALESLREVMEDCIYECPSFQTKEAVARGRIAIQALTEYIGGR